MKLEVDKTYDVVAVRPTKSGVIVRVVEDGSTELIHVSNISDRFVKDVNDFVEFGNSYQAKCIEGYDGRLQLSLKHLGLRNMNRSNIRVNNDEGEKVTKRESTHKPPYSKNMKHDKKESSDLDSMIEECNRAMQDKLSGKKSKNKRRR